MDLYREMHPLDPSRSQPDAEAILARIALYPGSAVFVAWIGDALVATCTLVVAPNLTRAGAPFALIENVVTASSFRRHGHGRAVLDAAINASWRAGCYKVMLLTGSQNPATLRFYQQVGFEQSKTGFQIRRPGTS
jgi:GNAT superfamily N-acetyltransferase